MLDKIQQTFSIYDLELLSDIKAHTIRIWEKRYHVLEPTRLNRNIRVYSTADLQKLLNLSVLYKAGQKISKLAKLSSDELAEQAREQTQEDLASDYHVNALLISMYELDETRFDETYDRLMSQTGFEEVFVHTFLPLLRHIGLLWQTDRIKPAHEHFISNIIYQKIVLNTAQLPTPEHKSSRVNVLFLPYGEIHELGLLYLNYHLKKSGERTIYLGRDIPFDDLRSIKTQFRDINWVCHFVIDRTEEEKQQFLREIDDLLSNSAASFQLIGRNWSEIKGPGKELMLEIYNGIDEIIGQDKP